MAASSASISEEEEEEEEHCQLCGSDSTNRIIAAERPPARETDRKLEPRQKTAQHQLIL
jgi:hypothetical protein